MTTEGLPVMWHTIWAHRMNRVNLIDSANTTRFIAAKLLISLQGYFGIHVT